MNKHDLPQEDLERLREETRLALRWAKKQGLVHEHSDIKDAMERADRMYRSSRQRESAGFRDQTYLQVNAIEAYGDVARLVTEQSKELRACWFDRRSITESGPGELTQKIEALHKAGINTIYFECDNGGYAMYDSKLLRKNPDLNRWNDWDPLREAIDAAHARGMKIGAWTKVFSVCNRLLDDQFKKRYPDQKFPPEGPVLSKHGSPSADDPYSDWALRMDDGSLPQRTHDLFLDPANPQARQFAQNMIFEIAEKYPDLDSIQYDYIRYPFHNEGMGLNDNNWKKFQSQFPRYLDLKRPAHSSQISAGLLKDWNAWKVSQIDSFVQDTSQKLLEKNPKLDLAAAVFPCDLKQTVRQGWETWIKNGWVETLNPMTYVPHDPASKDAEFSSEFSRKFRSDIDDIRDKIHDRGRLLPGIAVARVNSGGVVKQIEIARSMGLPGETLFASSVLDQRRLKDLELASSKETFENFTGLLRACWTAKDSDPTIQTDRRQFIKDSEILARSFKQLDSSSLESTEEMYRRISAFKSNLDSWLKQHPRQKNQWTDSLALLLQNSVNGLNSALR